MYNGYYCSPTPNKANDTDQHYTYVWKDYTISRLKKIIEELINMPPIKIPIWIYENLDLLKELGIKVKEKKEDSKKEV